MPISSEAVPRSQTNLELLGKLIGKLTVEQPISINFDGTFVMVADDMQKVWYEGRIQIINRKFDNSRMNYMVRGANQCFGMSFFTNLITDWTLRTGVSDHLLHFGIEYAVSPVLNDDIRFGHKPEARFYAKTSR